MSAEVVQLAAFRERRPVAKSDSSQPPQPVTAHLWAESGRVVLRFSNGNEVGLTPASARVWAERLAAMADVAEAPGGGR
jgi:hypothetical protein